MHENPTPSFTVLLVCTGNICRSAMAERLGRHFLDEALGERAAAVRLVSAGTGAVGGSAMHPDSATVLRGLGAEPGEFRARRFVEKMADDADLILTMTRSHRQEVLERSPRTLARTFTLREAADLLTSFGDDIESPGGNLAERARRLVRGMAAARSRRHSGEDDDILDPIGRPPDAHQETGAAIAQALLPVLRHLVSLDRPGTDEAPAGDRPNASVDS